MRKFTLFLMSLFLTVGAMAQLTTGQYYKIKNVDTDLYLTVAGNNVNMEIRSESPSVLQYFKLEDAGDGKFHITATKGEEKYYAYAESWNFKATKDGNKTAFTINLIEGEEGIYSLNQQESNYKGDAGTDAATRGSVVYCNKAVGNNGKWAFEAVEKLPAGNFEIGKQYRLKSELSGLYFQCVDFAKTSGEGAFQLKNKSAASGQIFELENSTDEGEFYLKTTNNNDTYYVQASSWNFYASGKENAASFKIELLENELAIYTLWQDSSPDQMIGYAGAQDAGANTQDGRKVYNNQGNLTGCTTWVFEEVADEVAKITYVYKYKGVEVTRETVDAIVGVEYPALPNVPRYYVATKPSGVVTADETVEVVLTANLPFEFSASVETVSKWYFIKMHPDYPTFVYDDNGALPCASGTTVAMDDERRDYFAWAFVGDILTGFKVVNKTTGKAISSNGSGDATTAEIANATAWVVEPSAAKAGEQFFVLKYPNGTNYLNANHSAKKLQHWNEADGGSTMQVLEYTVQDNKQFEWLTTSTWTPAKELTSTTLSDNALDGGINYIDYTMPTGGPRTVTMTFKYINGGHKLNIRGIEILDEKGNIVSGDYHVGTAGGSHINHVYTVKVACKGEYKVRCYATEGSGDEFSHSHGTITASFAKPAATDFAHELTFAAEYATLHLGYQVAVPTDVEAYVVSEIDGIYAMMTKVEGVIPAATPVILKNVGTEKTYTFSYTADEATAVGTNLLKGSIANRYVTEEAYVLGYLDDAKTEIGFGKAITTGQAEGTFLNNANKAYLPMPAASGVSFYGFRFDEEENTTGIEVVENANENVIYDLAGRRVSEITAPGIYIIDGKKVLVK